MSSMKIYQQTKTGDQGAGDTNGNVGSDSTGGTSE